MAANEREWTRMGDSRLFAFIRGLFVLALVLPGARAQKFLPDDPIQIDPDNRDIPAPKPYKLSDYYDFLENSFGHPGDHKPRTAMNINTLGEVPNSSWFTNRHGRKRLTPAQLAKGPDRGTGPAEGTWTVTRAKNEGVTPGFFITDARGDRYLIKFDPPSNLEMATSVDVMGSKFFYAMGYNVPENYIAYFEAGQLQPGAGATVTDVLGKGRRMDSRDIQELLNRVARLPDGRHRAVASRILPGEDMGPFHYYGTRPDDSNDIFPHEHHRELRGLWVLAAWLNHDDSRAINTLDLLVKENGRQFLRHHLIDFGSILGSGSENAQKPRAGNEYLWEPGIAFRRMLMLGFWDRTWILIRYPYYPAIGRIEAERFEPEKWKPEYPNPAFRHCLPEDAYWAAKIAMSFTDEDIRAIVKTGQISDPWGEEYLVQTIIKRRDKVGRYWLRQVNSVDNFRLEGSRLHFEDLAVKYGLAKAPASYAASWYRYDNDHDRKIFFLLPSEHAGSPLPIPEQVLKSGEGAHYTLQIRRKIEGDKNIPKAVHVYFRRAKGRLELVGIERDE